MSNVFLPLSARSRKKVQLGRSLWILWPNRRSSRENRNFANSLKSQSWRVRLLHSPLHSARLGCGINVPHAGHFLALLLLHYYHYWRVGVLYARQPAILADAGGGRDENWHPYPQTRIPISQECKWEITLPCGGFVNPCILATCG
jgi:hypothetical protein